MNNIWERDKLFLQLQKTIGQKFIEPKENFILAQWDCVDYLTKLTKINKKQIKNKLFNKTINYYNNLDINTTKLKDNNIVYDKPINWLLWKKEQLFDKSFYIGLIESLLYIKKNYQNWKTLFISNCFASKPYSQNRIGKQIIQKICQPNNILYLVLSEIGVFCYPIDYSQKYPWVFCSNPHSKDINDEKEQFSFDIKRKIAFFIIDYLKIEKIYNLQYSLLNQTLFSQYLKLKYKNKTIDFFSSPFYLEKLNEFKKNIFLNHPEWNNKQKQIFEKLSALRFIATNESYKTINKIIKNS